MLAFTTKPTFINYLRLGIPHCKCGKSEITVVTPASSNTGLSASNYREGSGSSGLDGSDTNGWCWNGGDNQSNTFKGHAGWNQSSYGCYGAGHLAYVGVFTNGSTQYTNSDITGTTDLQYQLLFDQSLVLHSIIVLSDESNKYQRQNTLWYGGKTPHHQLDLLLTEDGHRVTTFTTIEIVDNNRVGTSSLISHVALYWNDQATPGH